MPVICHRGELPRRQLADENYVANYDFCKRYDDELPEKDKKFLLIFC